MVQSYFDEALAEQKEQEALEKAADAIPDGDGKVDENGEELPRAEDDGDMTDDGESGTKRGRAELESKMSVHKKLKLTEKHKEFKETMEILNFLRNQNKGGATAANDGEEEYEDNKVRITVYNVEHTESIHYRLKLSSKVKKLKKKIAKKGFKV